MDQCGKQFYEELDRFRINQGGFNMRRKIIGLITAIMLVTGMVATTSFATSNTRTHYSTTTKQVIYTTPNSTGTAYGRLDPAATSPAAKLGYWDSSLTTKYAEKTYAAYPPNPDYVTYTAYYGAKFAVRPVIDKQYIWGEGTCWNS